MEKNILALDSKDAMDFFLKSEQYHGFELPEYFVFDTLLQSVKDTIGDIPYEECLQEGVLPEQLSDVNLDILLNKDGRYAVRPIILANPFLYYFLVCEICNDKDTLEKISYILQHVLESLNFRMNSKKTKICDSIVTDSIKSDKLVYIYNTPIFNKKGCDFDSFEKHLLYILMFARQYPDSGSIKTMLSDVDKRIEKWLEPQECEIVTIESSDTNIFEKSTETYQRKLVGGSVRAMSAICTQIALENVGCCHYVLRVLCRMVDSLEDKKEKWDIIDKVYSKLCNQPNSDYNQLWLQNITYQEDKKNGTSPYTLRLCQLVADEEGIELWNNEWLETKYTSYFPYDLVINSETLKKVTPVITFRETRAYYVL